MTDNLNAKSDASNRNGHSQNGHVATEPELVPLDAQPSTDPPSVSLPEISNSEIASPELAATLPLTLVSDSEAQEKLVELYKSEEKLVELYKPDRWSYAAVGTFLTFSLVSIGSTFISTQLLISLLSSGVGAATSIPFLWTTISIPDAVAGMGTGILEGAGYSDAYLNDYKKMLKGNAKRASQFGRFMGFIAQSSLYYMALASLLFQSADMGLEQTLKESDAAPTAALTLEPPTALHGVFVGSVSVAWSYGTTYLGPTALLMAIAALRRKPKPNEEVEPLPQSEPEPEDNQKRLDALKILIEQIRQQLKQKFTNYLRDVREQELTKRQTELLERVAAETEKLQSLLNSPSSTEGPEFDQIFDGTLDQFQPLTQEMFDLSDEEVAQLKGVSRPQQVSPPEASDKPAAPPSRWFNRSFR